MNDNCPELCEFLTFVYLESKKIPLCRAENKQLAMDGNKCQRHALCIYRGVHNTTDWLVERLKSRELKGLQTYHKTLVPKEGHTKVEMLNELIDELLDAANYATWLIETMKGEE